MRVKRRSLSRRKSILRLLMVLLAAAAAVFLNQKIANTVRTVASAKSQLSVSRLVHQAVQKTLEENRVSYDSMVSLRQNQNGDTTALITDTIGLSRLQAEIMKNIIQEIKSFEDLEITVPLGTLLGGHWLSGLGPRVGFHLVPAGTVETKIYNDFEACGINQTHHQIKLEVKASVVSVISGYRARSEAVTTIVLAETVIVGLVPEAYTEVHDGTGNLTSMLEDYGAEAG